MTQKYEKCYTKWSGARCYFAHGDSNSKGVAVLIYDRRVKVINADPDPKGRYLLLELSDNDCDKPLILLNVYAPTKDKTAAQADFIETMGTLLSDHIDKPIILGGDQNLCIDPDLDKKGGTKENTSSNALKLQGVLDNLDLVDIWRLSNLDNYKYTWRGKADLINSLFQCPCLKQSLTQL